MTVWGVELDSTLVKNRLRADPVPSAWSCLYVYAAGDKFLFSIGAQCKWGTKASQQRTP